MKVFSGELNTKALDSALMALFNVEGRDNVKRVYELLNADMETAFAEGQRSTAEGIAAIRAADAEVADKEKEDAFWRGVAQGVSEEAARAKEDRDEVSPDAKPPETPPFFPASGLFGDDDKGYLCVGPIQRDSGDENLTLNGS